MKALEKAEIDEEAEEEVEEQVAPPDKKEDGESDNEFGSPKLSPDNDNNNSEFSCKMKQLIKQSKLYYFDSYLFYPISFTVRQDLWLKMAELSMFKS